MTTDNTRSDARAMATSDAITLLETALRLGAALLTLTRHRRRVRRRALTRGLLHMTTRFWEPRRRARRQHGASQRWVNTVRRPALQAAGSTQVRSAANRKCNHTIHDTRARVHAAGSTQRGAVSGRHNRMRRAADGGNTSAADACLATGVRTVGFESTT